MSSAATLRFFFLGLGSSAPAAAAGADGGGGGALADAPSPDPPTAAAASAAACCSLTRSFLPLRFLPTSFSPLAPVPVYLFPPLPSSTISSPHFRPLSAFLSSHSRLSRPTLPAPAPPSERNAAYCLMPRNALSSASVASRISVGVRPYDWGAVWA